MASASGTIAGNFVAFVDTALVPIYRFELGDARPSNVRQALIGMLSA